MKNILLLQKILKENSKQEIISILANRPVIHFSDCAEEIMNKGFIYGTTDDLIDFSYDENYEKIKKEKGINFAFDTLSFLNDYNCYDYEYGIENGIGMHSETAVIFSTNCIKTIHPDGFKQCLFYGENINTEQMLLLKNEGIAIDDNGEELYDENGNSFDSWSVKQKDGTYIIDPSQCMSLSECVSYVSKNKLSNKQNVDDFNSVYYENVFFEKNNDMFQVGYCLEFAITLQEYFPEYELVLLGGKYKNPEYDPSEPEYEEEYLFEACHAALINPEEPDYIIDSNGYVEIDLDNMGLFFNNKIEHKTIYKIGDDIELAESFLGTLVPEAQIKAKDFINENINLFFNIKTKKTKKICYNL